MVKIFFTLLILPFLTTRLLASDFTAVITMEKTKDGLIMRSKDGEKGIPFKVIDEKINKKLTEIVDRKEAIVYGQIDYNKSSDGGLTPIFMIERLSFVSLRKLGTIYGPIAEPQFSPEKQLTFVPYSFPVTTELASALTLTSSLLLMNSLTAGENRDVRDDIRNGLFISAGTMATLLFLYEQLSGKTKP